MGAGGVDFDKGSRAPLVLSRLHNFTAMNDEGEKKRGGVPPAVVPNPDGLGPTGNERVNPNAGKTWRKVYQDRVTAGRQPLFLPPSRKGTKGKRFGFGFKPNQAQRISRGIEWLTATYGQKNLRFVTLTFAREVEHEEAKKRWSTLQKRIKRLGPIDYVWVAEIQPARLLRDDEAVIHFHAVLSRPLDAKWLWDAWEEINGERSRVDIQRIRSSAAAYMAKYMAKAGKEAEHVGASVAEVESADVRALRGQMKMRQAEWEALDEDTRRYLAERMTIQGNRTGQTQGVSAALKPIKTDEQHWSDAVPEERKGREKVKMWFPEQYSFLAVWGFDDKMSDE